MLRSNGEDDLAERVASITDDEMRIRRLGAYYALSEDAMVLGGRMGGDRALSLAIDWQVGASGHGGGER